MRFGIDKDSRFRMNARRRPLRVFSPLPPVGTISWKNGSLDSRRKAYYLMTIHEHLTRVPKPQLQEIGWTKARELVKVARRDGPEFACAPWVHKAKQLPKEQFRRAVERHLTGKETESWEIIYFKRYKSQLLVVEKALETAGLMLGTDKSRGYCLEMICADFLAGAGLGETQRQT
jgi:hypothetical protein